MNYYVIAYAIYLPVSIMLSIWIARRLHQNTKAFLLKKFNNDDALASSTNNLVQTGFYLLAFGYAFLYMRIQPGIEYFNGTAQTILLSSGQETIESLSAKLGAFTFFLGILLFVNFILMLTIQSGYKQSHRVELNDNQNK